MFNFIRSKISNIGTNVSIFASRFKASQRTIKMMKETTKSSTMMLRITDDLFHALRKEAFETCPAGKQQSVQELIRIILGEHVAAQNPQQQVA